MRNFPLNYFHVYISLAASIDFPKRSLVFMDTINFKFEVDEVLNEGEGTYGHFFILMSEMRT